MTPPVLLQAVTHRVNPPLLISPCICQASAPPRWPLRVSARETRHSSLKLSGSNCTDNKVASVFFELAQSTNINTATGNLKNTVTTGGADKVEIGLLDSSKAVLDLNTANNNPKTAVISGNTARFDYWAQYVATGGAATAGKVTTDVIYSIKYQ